MRKRKFSAVHELAEYLADIGEPGRLTTQQERDLGYLAMKGDIQARDILIAYNLPLVVFLARKFPKHGISLADMVSAGNIGLVEHAADFDPARGVKFATYIIYWIRNEMHHLVQTANLVYLPKHAIAKVTAWRNAVQKLWEELERLPTFEEVADEVMLTKRERTNWRKYYVKVLGASSPTENIQETE
jgi:RNA polymerase sigma factor (sigma-70 family)